MFLQHEGEYVGCFLDDLSVGDSVFVEVEVAKGGPVDVLLLSM